MPEQQTLPVTFTIGHEKLSTTEWTDSKSQPLQPLQGANLLCSEGKRSRTADKYYICSTAHQSDPLRIAN